jgi:hypothetical protein
MKQRCLCLSAGGEGSVRPPSAAPSVLQPQRCREQPVPEAAAQLAQHFVTGGCGQYPRHSAPHGALLSIHETLPLLSQLHVNAQHDVHAVDTMQVRRPYLCQNL